MCVNTYFDTICVHPIKSAYSLPQMRTVKLTDKFPFIHHYLLLSLNILLVARTTPIHIQPKPEIHPCSINWYIVILIKATMIIHLHALGWRSDTLIMHFTIGTINNPTIPNRPMTTTQKRYLLFPSINFDISKISFLFSLILGNLDVKVTQRTIYWAQRLCFTSRWMNSSLHQSLLYTF